MSKVTTDIDIDFGDRDSALTGLMHVAASMEGQARHPSGVYFQNVPTDPLTGYSSLLYDEAGDRGYFKIDFLNNSIYTKVRSEEHLVELMRDPPWDFLEIESFVEMLPHIRNSFGLVSTIKPRSVEDLAVILALQRPGGKHLVLADREKIDAEIWKPSEQFSFKRAHAIAYAVSIVVQMNLLIEQMEADL